MIGEKRPNRGAIAGNPVLIGAATALIVIVAVFLAYNANNGLPFVPTYEVSTKLPNAGGLIRGNEVRLGGARVGIVSGIEPDLGPDNRYGAVVRLKLDKTIQPIPADSTVRVRPRSPLGLKYVELTRGQSDRPMPAGAVIDASGQPEVVEIDDFFNIFDKPTREASQASLNEAGNVFAGRGASLNQAFADLEPLIDKLGPVMANLMDRRTGWARFFPALEQAATEVAPVAAQHGELWVGLSATFTALADASDALQASISEGPEALRTATRELPAQAALMRESTTLFAKWRPAFAHLADASVDLAPAFRTGTPALRRAVGLNDRLADTLDDLEAFGTDERVVPALERMTETAELLDPIFAYAAPAQTDCNYLSLFFRNLASAFSETDAIGSFLRVYIIGMPQLPGSEAGPAAAPANGPPGADVAGLGDSFLHANPYPNTAAPGQDGECEAASEEYASGRQQIGSAPGNQNPKQVVEPTVRKEADR